MSDGGKDLCFILFSPFANKITFIKVLRLRMFKFKENKVK